MATVQLAKALSREGHSDQLYGGRPYSYHIDCVVAKVNFLFGESRRLSELQTIAYLHDIVEDIDTNLHQLKVLGFSKEVVFAVKCITKTEGEGLEKYYDRVALSKLAFKVKVADTLSNLEHSCRERQTKRINKYTNQLQELYARKDK